MHILFLGISLIVTLILCVSALMLLVPALNFFMFQLGVLALEWSPWMMLACIANLGLLSTRLVGTGTLVFTLIVLNLIALLVFIWQTYRAITGTIKVQATMPVVSVADFRLGRFFYDPSIQRPFKQSEHVYATIDGQDLKFDVYQPLEQVANAPALVVVHGGSWRSGTKSNLPVFNRYLASSGFVVFDLDYRLAPEFGFPAAVSDVKCALGFIKQHASKFGIDPERIVLLGRSAGAQIALLAAYSDATIAASCGVTDAKVCGVIGYYSPTRMDYYDIIKPQLSPGALRDYLGGPPEGREELYQQAQPKSWINDATPPTLLLHGGRDQYLRPRESQELYDALVAANRPAIYVEIPWANHGFDYNFNGLSHQRVLPIVLSFLRGKK